MKRVELTPDEEAVLHSVLQATDKLIKDSDEDLVDRPAHYTQGAIECIDAMVAAKGAEAVATYCELAIFKYCWRLGLKDHPHTELGKIIWYAKKAKELRDGTL